MELDKKWICKQLYKSVCEEIDNFIEVLKVSHSLTRRDVIKFLCGIKNSLKDLKNIDDLQLP